MHQAAAGSTTMEVAHHKCSDKECRQSHENAMLMKFIREQQRKKQQQLLDNPKYTGDRQSFRHHNAVKATTTTSAPKIRSVNGKKTLFSKRNAFINSQNITTTLNIRRNSTQLPYNTTTGTGTAHNGTEPYAEQIVLYMVAQRKCNHHRRRC